MAVRDRRARGASTYLLDPSGAGLVRHVGTLTGARIDELVEAARG